MASETLVMFFKSKESNEQAATARRAVSAGNTRGRLPGSSNQYYDALVRRLQSIEEGLNGNGPCAIGVTSCHSGEGVTTVAVNLTRAASRFMAGPILLIDANTARPAITHMMAARRHAGLVNVLAGEASVFDCVVDSPIEGVSMMPHGKLADGLQPAYDKASIDETLDSIKHVFPLIIVDLPVANELTTCLALSAKLDGVLLVVEADRVEADVVIRVTQQLKRSGADVLGVVFNKQRE